MGNNDVALFVVAGVAAAVFLLSFVLINGALERRRRREEQRLHGRETDSESSGVLARALPTRAPGEDRGFRRMVVRTGLEVGPAQALALILLTGVVLGAGLYLWREQLWLGGLGLAVGCGAVLGIFAILQARHQRLLQNQLPDTYYLLARSLRAGLSLEQAIALTGEEGLRPLADEFRRCAAQVQLGLTVPAALQLTARRLQLLDFNAFVSTVSMYQATGGNLPLLLDRLAAATRDRNQFRNYFLAATALGRATAVALALAAPALVLAYAIFQPSFAVPFFQSRAGLTTLGIGLGLELIGAFWLYKLLSLEY
jgi:tight adherence protein B